MKNPTIKDGMSRVSTEYGDVILDEVNGRYWHANPTASTVLDTIEAGGDRAEAVERLAERFDADRAVVRADVDALLARLQELGVIA